MKSAIRLLPSIGCLGSIALWSAPAASPPDASKPFHFEAVTTNSLGLWEGTRPVFVYNHGTIQNTNAPGNPGRATYFHPIYGLHGEVLTDDFPKDHTYHRGLYWAWPHIRIAGAEYDLWSLKGIRSEFRRWLARETTSNRAVLAVENVWIVEGREVMNERIRAEVHPASEQGQAIDLELQWTPMAEAVSLSGAPGKSYGGLTLRFARTQPIITVPTGRTSEDLLMAKLPWADFSGAFGKDTNVLSGAAIFVHPQHADFPPTWMTRHYGVLAVGWPGLTPRVFPPGKTFSCRYRLWIHANAPRSDELQKHYDAYRAR